MSAEKKAAAIAKEKALFEERAAREKALAFEKAAQEALARQPGFSSGSFADRNRIRRAMGKASRLIEKGEPLRGAKDPRVEKIAREAPKECKRENDRGMSL